MGSNLRDIYNAIKANGDFKVERSFEDFASKMNYKGYQNQIYNLLKTNGAKLSGGPDTFRRKLGLQRIDAHPEWTEKQRQKRLKEMQGDGSGAMIMRDNPAKQKPIENQSAFVHSLEAGRVTAENDPAGTNVMAHDEKQRQLSGVVGTARAKTMSEDPLLDPSHPGVSLTVGQFNERAAKSASGLLDTSKAFDTFAKDEIDAEFKRAREAYAKEYNKYADYKYSDDLTQALGTRMANEKMKNSEMAKSITKSVEANLSKYISDELTADKIHTAAKKAGMPDDYFAKNFLLPEMQNRILEKFRQADLERYMPRTRLEYILRGIEDSMVGKLANSLKYGKEQRQMLEEANAVTQQGDSRFVKPSMMDNVVRGAVSYAADSPLYAAAGMGASAGIAKATGWNGVKLASRMANTNLLGKIGYGATYGVAHGFLTGASFGAVNGAVQNFSTSDDTSVGAYLKAMGSGALSSGVNFAGMEGVGGAFAPLGYKIGINGLEKTSGQVIKHGAQKVGFEVAKTAMEGVGMATGGVLESIVAGHPQGFTVEGTLESCVTAALFKLTHVKDAVKGPARPSKEVKNKNGETEELGSKKAFAANFSNNLTSFFASDQAKSAHLVFNDHERKQILDAVKYKFGIDGKEDLKKLSSKLENNKLVYEMVMNDKDIPWDVRNKFTAYTTGVFIGSRPIMNHYGFSSEGEPGKKTKYVCEYSKDGEVLSMTPYKTSEERERIVYEKKARKVSEEIHNKVGAYIFSIYDDPDLKREFLIKNKGFDPSKPLDDPKNKEIVEELKRENLKDGEERTDLQNEYVKFLMLHDRTLEIFDEVAKEHGLTLGEIVHAFYGKDILECTEMEANALAELGGKMKDKVFTEDKVHAEQSTEDGKEVAANNNLGTEEPNNEAVVAVANELSQAEKEWQAAMDSNAELGGMYNSLKKQGLRNDQIYEAMLQNGATEEDLAPLAKYINANAKMQGMVDGTAKTIKANVQARVEDFSYKGTLNGEKQDGENMVYVTDADGRQLLVTSGDVAFDKDANPKEGVGDMLICRDEQTGEIVRVSVSDVKFAGTKTAEEYGNEFRQHLQEKNSEAYAIAQKQQEGEGEGNGGNTPEGNQPPKDPEGPQGPEGEGGGTLPEGGGTPPPSAPQEEGPKFADGTPVPMTKDSKGRPTADYTRMTPEQGAEYMTTTFGDSAENVVDGKVKKAEKAVKDASKMKVDYSADDADILAQEEEKKAAMEKAQKGLDLYKDIKKAIVARRTAESLKKKKEERHEPVQDETAIDAATAKFQEAPKVEGRKGTITLPNGKKISGKYVVVPAKSLTPSHDPFNGYKPSEGVPLDENGNTVNDRDYEHDKDAQIVTEEMGNNYGGQAVADVPVVNPDGKVISGNGRTMAGQLAAERGKDSAYIEALKENAEGFGIKAEDIEGVEHPRVVFVPDEALPYDSKTFAEFNKNEKKTQSNTQQAVAKSKTLDDKEVGAIVAEIEGSGSLEAFFNNPKAINDLVKTLLDKGIIGRNDVAELLEANGNRLSPQGKEFVKNLLLGGIFKSETIQMMGIDNGLKTKVINGIRSIMQNMKLGEYSLREEVDNAVALIYEAKRAGMSVSDYLRQNNAFEENARDKYSQVEQALAQALDGSASLFRDLMAEYNKVASARNTGEENMFGEHQTKEDFVKEFVEKSKTIKENDIKLFGNEEGHKDGEGGSDAAGDEKPAGETGSGAEETQRQVDEVVKAVATEITEKTGIEVVTDEKAAEERIREAEESGGILKFSAKKRRALETASVSRDEKHQPTVVSSAAGAKVLNELDTAIENYENRANRPKTFLGDTAKALGATQDGSASEYATFETKNGKIVTIRLANHNATVSNFDIRGESEGISIVITPKENHGIINDGEAHIVEFFYDAIKLRRADGKPLAEILRSIKQSLYSGEFKDTTGLADRQEVNAGDVIKWQRVYHGSGADFDHFDHSHMGEGEGAQAYGWGTYVTEVEGIGRTYAEQNSKMFDHPVVQKMVTRMQDAMADGKTFEEAKREALERMRPGYEKTKGDNDRYSGFNDDYEKLERLTEKDFQNRHLYTVEIPDDTGENYLDWDKPLTRGQIETIREGLVHMMDSAALPDSLKEKLLEWNNGYAPVVNIVDGSTGKQAYETISEAIIDRNASKFLSSLGFVGIKYPADFMRGGREDGKKNYVIFNEKDARIVDHVRFFRTKDGEVYGFTDGEKIYLDLKRMKPETPLHEYAHLWVEGLKAVNAEEWENVKALFDKVEGLKEEVQKLYPELKGDDLYEEMITTFSGREGAKKLEQTVRELAAKEGKSVTESAKAQGFVDKVREGLQRFWKGVADMLHIHFTTAEEVADKVLADWAKGVDPKAKKEKDVFDRIQELLDMTPEESEELARRNAELEEKERKAEIQKKFDELKASFPTEKNNPYSKALKESKTPEEAAAKFREMAAEKRAVARDWQNRRYKKNNNRIDSHDIYGEEKTTTISAANERRRKAAVNNALEAAKDYDEFADTILKRCGLSKDTVPVIKEPSQEPSADPMEGLGKAAEEYKEDQALRNGQILNGPKTDKPWNEMTGEERLAVAEKNPLTEEEIRNNTSEENEDLIEDAVDYVNGNHGIAQQLAYLKIYEDVRNRHKTASDNSGAEDGTQLAAPGNGSGEGLGHGTGGTGGGTDGPLDKGNGGDTAPGKPDGGKGGASDPALPSGEQGHNEGKGGTSELGPVAPRGAEPNGRGASGTNGSGPKRGGRGSGNGPAGTDAGRKPAAKQGTTLGNSTRAEVRKEKEEAKQSLKDALKELRRRGRGSASISLVGMNSEQIEYIPEVMKAVKRYGMAVIKDGLYKLKDWVKDIRGAVEEDLKDIGLSDNDIDDFINEMWKSKFKMDGEVHTIEEWAGIYGREQLRKALATPLEEKRKMQKEAESVAVKVGDRENIAETLPFLLPEQQEDVMKAETQFFDPSHADDEHGGGRGMLFTNGTGTGKTYTGLGIVKRFIKQGKGRVLIVTPSQEKVTDWKNDATNLGITLTPLETSGGKSATKQKGKGAVITTFANFRANKALLEDVFDLVVYDESHKLMESKDAKETSTTQAHYRITNKDFDSAKERITMSHPLWREQEQLMRERKKLMHGSESLDEARLNNEVSDAEIKRLEEIEARLEEVRSEQEKLMPEIDKQARESVGKTKVVFLSATPFNTRENLDYVEGYLFSYGKPEVGENASAEEYARAKQQLRTSFYRQKFPHGSAINASGRLVSDTSDAVKLDDEERKFADTLMANGVMSGRTIDNGYDYSRDFPVVSVTHANEFNTSLKQMRDSLELRKFASEVFDDYNRMSVIYETMKVSAVRDRIKGHMERGRRIVVFHRRRNDNQGLAEPPFAAALKMAEEYAAQLYAKNDSRSVAEATKIMQAVEQFRQDHIALLHWEQTLDYRMPREQLRSLFGDAHEYTPEEMAELNLRRGQYVDAAFNGRLEGMTPYEAGKKYGEACFDLEDSNVVRQYKPHKITDEEAEQMGIKKPSDREYNAKLEAYNKIAEEVKRGIDDAIKERVDKGIIKIELDENGKQVRHVGLFAGGDGKESKHNDVLSFNKDDSKMDIIVVQEASGKEGISLHDTTGEHQRVMINLALPQSPIAFIQAEGRIFRIGQKSNAIFEYPMLGIDNEVALFAGRFNGRAATTENLALGSMARGLRSSITRGILSKMGKVPLDGQGVGGREFDLRDDQRKGGYDAAVEDYKNGDHIQDTSIDDMGTPEPIGYKMVEWANMREGESTLEPSAGNGNVSRYIPSDISSLSIEPDTNKSNRLMLQTGGVMRGSDAAKGRKTQVMNGKFEDLSAVNKFDTVVMNSPNGAEGDTAIAHLGKAIQHLNDSGRVVAVIPDTDKMNKAVEELIAGNTALHLSGVVKMPACAYTAGGVSQKTKIVVIDKLTREETRNEWKETQETDLSDVKDINTLFDKLKDVKMPERVIDPAAKSMRHANAAVAALGKLKAFGRGSTLVVGDKRVWVWPTKAVLRATDWGVHIDGGSYKPFHKESFWYEEIKDLKQDVLMQYHLCGEVLKMSDKEIADNIFSFEKKKQTTYVEDLKEYCRAVQKMLRGISGHTDGEMERAYNGEDVNSKVQMTPGTKLSMDELKDVFDSCNKKDEELGFLFDKVYAVAKGLGLDVSVYSDENTRTSAYYDGKGNKMRINSHFWNANKIIDSKGDVINMNDQKRAEVITHELIHSVTSYAEYWNRVDPSRLPEPLREAATELEELYKTAMRHEDSWRLPSYCKENASEFVAEAANPDARNVLKKMGLWTRFVNAVKKFFTYYARRNAIASGVFDADGFEYTSAYTELDKVIDKFLNNFDKESYDAYVAVASGREDMAEGSRPEDLGLDRLNHKVEDKEEIERLENENQIKMFSAVQIYKGKPYSPMAAIIDGKRVDPIEINGWDKAEEHPELVDEDGNFKLQKTDESKGAGEGDVYAAYNPYNHLSSSIMNDQFTGAYARGNIKVVEWFVPKSEKYSGYHAEKAKDPVGVLPWHSGSLNGLLPKERQRAVMLSRYRKAYRLVPDDEVAKAYDYAIKDTDLAIPWNVVTPNQLEELAKIGTPITTIPTGTVGEETTGKFKAQMAELKEKYPQAVFVDKKMTKDEYKKWGIGTDSPKGKDKIKIGETFSKSNEAFDKVRDRALRETGTVLPNLEKERVRVVDVPDHEFSGDNEIQIRKEAEKWGIDNLVTKEGDTLPQMRDGTPYSISKRAIGKYVDETSLNKSVGISEHLSVLKKLKDVIKESIEAEIHPDYKKNEVGDRHPYMGHSENVLVHRLYGAVMIKGKLYRVKTTMQEFRGNNPNRPHSFEVTKIELLDSPTTEVLPNSGPSDVSNNSITGAKLLKNVGKSYQPWKDLLEESKNLSPRKTHFRVATAADGASRSDSVSVVEDHVEKVSKKLGTKVNVVNSIDEVSDPRVKADIEAGKNVTGWYDEKTGQVHLYMPNVKDTYTAERTIWHETVGHKGMRGLLGDKWGDYLKGLWMDLDNPINKELREYVRERMNRDSLSFYDAIEEFLADAAEKGKGEQGFWANIKNKVTDALREIGYRIAPCTSDIKYMLWLAKNVQKHPDDPVWKMRAEAAKWKFEHEHLDDMDIHGTTLYENDGKDHSLEGMSSSELNEATDGKIHYRTLPSAATAIDRYTRALNKASYMATEAYMDNMLSLKELLLAINPDVKNVEDIESYLNPYTLQNTMQGAMDATAKRFEREMMQPLDKAVANVLKAFGGKNQKERMRDFSLYLIKKHGLERNRVFYVRDTVNKLKGDDATKADGIKMQNEWNAEKKRLGDALRNGQVTLKEYYDQMDEWIRKNIDPSYQAGEHDYSGVHGMYGLDDKAAYDDAAVIDEVMSAESAIEGRVSGGVKDMWSKIHAATMFSVYSDYKNGIISKELFNHVSGMFDWYVPLRKFDEKTAEDVYGYINEDGHSDSFIGQTISKASGRYSLSDVNILGQIGALGNRAILNGGHNKIKQAFARFVRENYDRDPDHRLVTECDIWLEKAGTDNNGKPIWMEAFPDIPEGSTPKKVSKIVKDFEDKMKAKEANGEAKRMKDKGSIPYRVTRQKDRSEHIVVVSIAGKEHCFVINANPRAAQALNGLLEQKNSTAWSARAGRGIIRWMAEACTSYNPEFVARNMVRDFEFASLNLAAKESARYVANFEKYYMLVNPFKAGKTVSIKDFSGSTGIGLFKKYREGTLDMNDKTQRWFKEFVDNGGMTGFVQLKNMKDLGKEYESDIATDLSLLKKGGKSVKDFLIGNIEHLNEIAENMARFATYCASREAGRDPQRSAYDAKEATVNFNRKGSGNRIGTFKTAEMGKAGKVAREIYGATASYLRQYSMFFNAGIQSTNMLLKNVKQHPVGTAAFIAAAQTALGLLMPLINQLIMNALNEDDKDRKGIKDPYAELPDYVRRNNLCIYTGKGEFLTIPLAIETRAFYGFGDMIHGLANGDIKMEDSPLQMAGLFGQLAPIADYLGNRDFADDPVGATFQALAPSFAVPLIEWYRNKDWKGSRIENRSEYVKNMPAWMRANTGTYSLLIDLNKKANAWSNDVDKGNPEMFGGDFWDTITNPSAIQHYFGGLGGGVATFAGKTVNAVEKAVKGETIEKKDIPFVRSFLYAPSETTSATRTKAKWYNYVDKMEKAKDNIDRLKKRDPDPEKAMHNADALYKYRESNTFKKVEIIKRAQKEIKRIKKMRARTTDPNMVNGYDDRVNTIMAEAVEQMDKLN